MNNKTILIANHHDDIIGWIQNEEYLKIHNLLNEPNWFREKSDSNWAFTELGEYASDNKLLKIVIDELIKHSFFITPSIIRNIIKCGHIELFVMLLDRLDIQLQTHYSTIINSEYVIKFLNIFLERGQRLSVLAIRDAIISNLINVVKYALENDYDVQSAYDKIERNQPLKCDVNMFKLLLNNNIDLTTNINHFMTDAICTNNLDNIMCLTPFVNNINEYLQMACINNNIPITKYFLQIGCDIDVIQGDTPINPTIDMVIFLDKCGLKINQKTLNFALLSNFITHNDTKDFSYYIEYGASMTYIFDMQKLDTTNNYYGDFPLEHIIWKGKLNHLKYLCENYYDLISLEFDALIIMACAYGNCEIIKYLYSLGVSIDKLLLIVACYFGKLDVIELLFSYGIDTNVGENLFCVLEEGYHKKCKDSRIYDEIINKNCIFKICDMKWWEQYTLKSIRNIIKKLIPLNIPIPNNSKFWSYGTLIIFDIDILQYYLDCGNDLNTNSDNSVVEICIGHGYSKIVKFLLDNGANWPSQKCLDICKNNKIYKDMFNL